MSDNLRNKNIELTKTEKIIFLLNSLGLCGLLVFCILSPFARGRNIANFILPGGICYLWFYLWCSKANYKKATIEESKLNRLFLGILLLSYIWRAFLYVFLEYSLGFEFSFKKDGGRPIYNHPIQFWIE
jgi:uncharacterized membrane protein